MEILPPIPRSPEFHFPAAAAAAAAAAHFPSSPPPFIPPFDSHHHFTSAPSSPSHAAAAIFSNFSFHSGDPPAISTADQLFEKGKIRPFHHPPPAVVKGEIFTKEGFLNGQRGRPKSPPASTSANRARESRSLSPLRTPSFIKISPFSPAAAAGNRKWRLKDLLLFRSASEGRGSRDPLRKYTLLSSIASFSSKSRKKGEEEEEEDFKCGSFRSTESGGGGAARRGGGGPPASAHEMHYTANRAAAGEKKKRTPLPYQRQGLFGCLQFNPAIRSITRGFNGFS